MEETKAKEQREFTVEELKNIASDLHKKCTLMYNELQKANMENAFKRLEFLFKVIKYKESFNVEFVNTCIKEVQDMMTLKEETVKEEA